MAGEGQSPSLATRGHLLPSPGFLGNRRKTSGLDRLLVLRALRSKESGPHRRPRMPKVQCGRLNAPLGPPPGTRPAWWWHQGPALRGACHRGRAGADTCLSGNEPSESLITEKGCLLLPAGSGVSQSWPIPWCPEAQATPHCKNRLVCNPSLSPISLHETATRLPPSVPGPRLQGKRENMSAALGTETSHRESFPVRRPGHRCTGCSQGLGGLPGGSSGRRASVHE